MAAAVPDGPRQPCSTATSGSTSRPCSPAFYLLWGARAGWLLRVAGALYALRLCALAWAFARAHVGRARGTLGGGPGRRSSSPSTSLPPCSRWPPTCSWSRRTSPPSTWPGAGGRFLSGALAGVAFLINPKGSLRAGGLRRVELAGLVRAGGRLRRRKRGGRRLVVVAGRAGPYWDQVWRWGRVYAGGTFVAEPLRNAVGPHAGWMGFHAAPVARRRRSPGRAKNSAGSGPPGRCSRAAAAAAGWRFFPRYFFQLLPVVVLLARARLHPARPAPRAGAWPRCCWCRWCASARAIPCWPRGSGIGRDTAMDRDSRAASALVRRMARPGDTLFVWGFRPEMYVYTGLPAAPRFLDSQPLTGVPADRHLTSTPVRRSRTAPPPPRRTGARPRPRSCSTAWALTTRGWRLGVPDLRGVAGGLPEGGGDENQRDLPAGTAIVLRRPSAQSWLKDS